MSRSRWLPAAGAAMAIVLAFGLGYWIGDGGTPEPTGSAPASAPPAPVPPAGWVSAGSFGGAGGTGTSAMSLTLGDAPVALSAACVGSGDLVVMVSGSASNAAQPAVGIAARFRCDVESASTRVELFQPPTGDVTLSAFVAESGGAIRHAAYNISVEQAVGVADPVRDGVPVLVTNGDDEAATVELRSYNFRTGEERVLVEPLELAPGESYELRMEPTFERNPAFELLINGYVALSSAFACDKTPPELPEHLPTSVKIVVMDNGAPAVCPFVEI